MALNPGQVLNNHYRVAKLVASGGNGTVYRAWDLHTNQPCALKENTHLTPEGQQLFEHEADLLMHLNHPNLPKVYEHFILPGGEQILVMEFVEGEDLEEKCANHGGALSEAQVLPWILQICDALTYLHCQTPPIIHRDIKPANIKIVPATQSAPERAVLVDFGIAKQSALGSRTVTAARAITPGFSPPEQYGKGTDQRSDIYSLSATLYTLLTGIDLPESIQRMMNQAIVYPPQQIRPGIKKNISDVIMWSMELEPNRRYQTVVDFKKALQNPIAIPPWHKTVPPPPTFVSPPGSTVFPSQPISVSQGTTGTPITGTLTQPQLKHILIFIGIVIAIFLIAYYASSHINNSPVPPIPITKTATLTLTATAVTGGVPITVTPTPTTTATEVIATPTPSDNTRTHTPTPTKQAELTPFPTKVTWGRPQQVSSGEMALPFLYITKAGVPYIAYQTQGKINDRFMVFHKSGQQWVKDLLPKEFEKKRSGWPSISESRDGKIIIGYFDLDDHRIHYLSYRGSWFDNPLQLSGNYFTSTSTGVDTNGKVYVAGVLRTDGDVYYVSSGINGISIDNTGFDSQKMMPGRETVSLAIDPGNGINLAYATTSGLRYNHIMNNTGTPETVDQVGGGVFYPSLALDSAGNPYISYFDPANQQLKLIKKSGSGWDSPIIIDSGYEVGQFTSLKVDSKGCAHVVYFDQGNNALKYAQVCENQVVQKSTVDHRENVRWATLALDPSGAPRISYYSTSTTVLLYVEGSINK